MIKQKKWAIILFVILLLFLGTHLFFYFKTISSIQTVEDWHKQLGEETRRKLQELERQREYLRLQEGE